MIPDIHDVSPTPPTMPRDAGPSPRSLRRSPRPDRRLAPVLGLLAALGLRATSATGIALPSMEPAHWAFRAVIRPEVPKVADPRGSRTPLDAFVLARLEEARIAPSPEADRAQLLRRLSLDLVGLPPTPEEVDAFVSDNAPDAYARVVERLLASPHYGERWGRHWLDAARYADSNGYEKDLAREMWHYRDWVLDALNRDMPYDQFVLEQVAGDLLPEATQEQAVATGFLRNSMINEEGAIDPEQFRMEALFDRMDCLGKAVLGLTIQCAQCHDHKYDPISQRDYYRLFAFLNDADELTAPVYGAAARERRREVLEGIRGVEDRLRAGHPDWPERLARWEAQQHESTTRWVQPELVEYGDPGGLSKLQLQPDQSLLAGGHRFSGGTWRVRATTPLTNITAVRLEALTNPNLPLHGPGRGGRGLFALREFTLEAAPLQQPTHRTRIAFTNATADFPPPAQSSPQDPKAQGTIQLAIDGKDATSWDVDAGPGRRNVDRQAVFPVVVPFGVAGGTELTFRLQCHDEIGCFRLSLTTDANAVVDPLPRPVREALRVPASRRSPAQRQVLFSHWRTTVPEFAAANAEIGALWSRHPEPDGTALTLHRRTLPRQTALLKRGDWLKPGEVVTAGVPAFLPPLPEGDAPARLRFARWLVDPRSPTAARVLVNRVWQAYFGTGLVTTPEDLGVRSELPSHPELLDWLASEFMSPQVRPGPASVAAPRPWSLKHLHRLIVHSATYRQRSRVTPEHLERDPYNRLLARGARFRVEGEVVRDIALSASGLLDPRVGGASVFAPAPAFLFAPPNSYGTFPWVDATDRSRYRRALYTFRRRSTPYPMLQAFDAPNGDQACVRRVRSNTPLQALTSLNEPLFVECARALARRLLEDGGATDAERLRHGFRLVTARVPEEGELQELQQLLERQQRHLRDGWTPANVLASGTNAPPAELPAGATPTRWAAYTVVARVLLNLDETITRE